MFWGIFVWECDTPEVCVCAHIQPLPGSWLFALALNCCLFSTKIMKKKLFLVQLKNVEMNVTSCFKVRLFSYSAWLKRLFFLETFSDKLSPKFVWRQIRYEHTPGWTGTTTEQLFFISVKRNWVIPSWPPT